jgi:DNA-binding FadR family transcriptional regulator
VPARYRTLADTLVADITEGRLTTGEQLPAIRALADQHAVSGAVAREAVRWLTDAGWVRAEHGRGVYVTGGRPFTPPAETRADRLEAVEAQLAEHAERLTRLEHGA